MKIVNLVNSVSITSIPSRWNLFLNKERVDVESCIVELNGIRKVFSLDKKKTLIHGHHVKSMTVFLLFNMFFRFKNIYTVHGSYLYLSKINKRLFNFVIKNTNYIAFVNTTLYDQLPESIKKKIAKKYQIIFNGVEDNYEFEQIDVLRKYNLDRKKTYIFHPARFVEEKNHMNVIEGFNLASKVDDSLELLLAGEGKLRPKIEAKIKKLELEEKVSLIGLISKDEVFNFYKIVEVFIMPSISEGLNVSFLEALSMNCKIVVSNIKQFTQPIDSCEFSHEDLNIKIADSDDIISISNKILESVNCDKIKIVKNPFSIDKMINDYVNLYKIVK